MKPHRKTVTKPIDAILNGRKPGRGVNHLVDAGWLEEYDHGYVFGQACGDVVGLSVEREAVGWVVAGPERPVERGRIDAPIAPIEGNLPTPEEVKVLLTGALRDALAHTRTGHIAGMGVAWPGPIERASGEPRDYEFHHEGFHDLDTGRPLALRPLVREALEEAGGGGPHKGENPLTIKMIKDSDADLLYELRFGKAKRMSNVVLVRLCGGLSLALAQNGELVRGHSGLAGGIQHVTVRFEDADLAGGERDNVTKLGELRPCEGRCQGRNCIARFATGPAIVDQLPSYDTGAQTYNERGRQIERDANDGAVRAVFGRAGRLLGEALIGPVLTFDPQQLIVGAFPNNPMLLQSLRATLTDGTRVGLGEEDIVAASTVPERAAIGAAWLVIEEDVVPAMERAVAAAGNRPRRADLPAWLRRRIPEKDTYADEHAPAYGEPDGAPA